MKHLSGSLDHPGCLCRPLFPVDRNAPYNDLHKDQGVEESGPCQALINGTIRFSFPQIALEQLRLSIFNSRNPL
jgi:hypothetical protein